MRIVNGVGEGLIADEAVPNAAEMPDLLASVEYTGSRIVALPFGLTYLPDAVRLPVSVLAVIAIALGAWVQRDRIAASTIALWVLFAVVSICYVVVVWRIMGYSLSTRHLIVALLPAMFAGFSLAAHPYRRRRVVLACWLAATFGFSAAATAVNFGPLAKGGDFRRVAQYLEAHEQAGQPIIVVPAHQTAPLGYYYRGINPIVPLPARDDFERYDRSRWRFESEAQVVDLLKQVVPGDTAFWVFIDYSAEDMRHGNSSVLNLDYFENVLARDYELAGQRDFYGAKVRLFRRK